MENTVRNKIDILATLDMIESGMCALEGISYSLMSEDPTIGKAICFIMDGVRSQVNVIETIVKEMK